MQEPHQWLEAQLKQASARARAHWIQDGIVEGAIGFYFLVLGGLFLIEGWLQVSISAFGLPLVTLIGVFALGPVIRRLKRSIANPIAGYAEPRQPSARQKSISLALGLIVGGLVGFSVAFFFASPETFSVTQWGWEQGLPLAQGTLFALVFVVIGARMQLYRFFAIALVALISGAAGSWVNVGTDWGTGFGFALVGIALMLSGIATYRQFCAGQRAA